MDVKDLENANALLDRLKKLKKMQSDLRPQFCNGVGICGVKNVNGNQRLRYEYNLWSTFMGGVSDEEIIMREGIRTMYEKVCERIKLVERKIEELK